MVRSGVDVIVANGDEAVVAAMAETNIIPIVMLSCDPLAMGFVKSLARPGGNVTGVSCMSVELGPKRVEIFKEAVPQVSNIAIIYNDENVSKPYDAKSSIAGAQKLGLKAFGREVREITDIEPAFSSAAAVGANGVIVLSEAFTLIHRQLITDLALKYRLPDMRCTGSLSMQEVLCRTDLTCRICCVNSHGISHMFSGASEPANYQWSSQLHSITLST